MRDEKREGKRKEGVRNKRFIKKQTIKQRFLFEVGHTRASKGPGEFQKVCYHVVI